MSSISSPASDVTGTNFVRKEFSSNVSDTDYQASLVYNSLLSQVSASDPASAAKFYGQAFSTLARASTSIPNEVASILTKASMDNGNSPLMNSMFSYKNNPY